MSSKDGSSVKDKVKRIFSKKRESSSGGDKAGKGADAYRPMSGSIKGEGSVPDSKTTSATTPVEGGASNAPAEVTSGGPGAASSGHGAASSGHGAASSGHGAGAGTESSTGNPAIDSVPDTYQDVTEPAGEDTGANRHWEAAREKTRAAELEAERAQRATAKAAGHLQAANAAQDVAQDHANKHQKALADADAIRNSIGDPQLLQGDVDQAKQHHQSKLAAHDEIDRKLQAALAEHQEKDTLAKERIPEVEEHHRKVTQLTEEYDKHVEEVKARESNKSELLAIADGHKNDLDQHDVDIDALTAELHKADQIAAEREREFIIAKDAAAALSARLAEAKEKREPMQHLYLAKQQEADGADEAIEGYRHETETLKRTLDEEEEYYRKEKNMEQNYQQDADDAQARLNALRAEAEPHSQALQAAENDLNNKQRKLDEAHAKAKEAEGKYAALRKEADHHKAAGDKAAADAQKHHQNHQAETQNAQNHHSRHREFWDEAKQHGTEGSNIATNVVHKLEEKLDEVLHGGGHSDASAATQA